MKSSTSIVKVASLYKYNSLSIVSFHLTSFVFNYVNLFANARPNLGGLLSPFGDVFKNHQCYFYLIVK